METQWERYGFMETYVENHYLVGGLEHCLFFHNMWDVIIPTDELIFFRGVGQPPASYIYFFLMGKPLENPRNISVDGGFGGII